MRYILFTLFVCFAFPCLSACPNGEKIARLKGLQQAISVLTECALYEDDDDTQLYLGQIYETGQSGIPQNMKKALLFYHLSAENGNAKGQVQLSLLMTKLDSQENGRMIILDYFQKLNSQLKNRAKSSFQGQMLHPYALLALAAEDQKNKWFYNTKTKTDNRAKTLLNAYKIETPEKETALRNASLWKQRKMLDVAREILSPQEYQKFNNTVYPTIGRPDAFARSRAVQELQNKLEGLEK